MNWAALNWVDWSIIAVLSVSTLLSVWRGFAREALSLLGWVAAFILASLFVDEMAVLLAGFIDNGAARDVAAFAIIFVVVLMLFNLLGVLLAQLIRLTGLGLLDRLLGTVFGFARGLIILLVVIFFVGQLLPNDNQQVFAQSQLMPHLELLMHWVQSMFGKMNISSALSNSGVPGIST